MPKQLVGNLGDFRPMANQESLFENLIPGPTGFGSAMKVGGIGN